MVVLREREIDEYQDVSFGNSGSYKCSSEGSFSSSSVVDPKMSINLLGFLVFL